MKKMLRIKIAIVLSILAIAMSTKSTFAQGGYLNCGTDEMVRKSLEANPQLVQEYLQEQARLAQVDQQAYPNGYRDQNRAAAVIYTIPIVFHVINEGGAENISDAQIFDEVRILNRDYAKLNPDTANIVASFRTIASNVQIQFALAQKDPNGNCTNGIDRVTSTLTNAASDNSKLNDWPRAKYLNVWTVKTIGTAGVAGYAYLPGTGGSAVDGVLILSSYVGSIGTGSVATSRALTHEIGHFLNLEHTWGNTNNPGVACGDDQVSDTPVTIGHTTCNLTDAGCTPPIIENVQNYMEYSYCSNMFTAGQRTRMRSALTSTIASRSSLWTASNLLATGITAPAVLCQANFESNSTTNNVLCQGDSIKYTDISWNGRATSWNWTFQGGTPAVSTDSTPTVTYNTAGLYNVGLSVSNTSGTVSTTKTSYIRVNPSTAMYNNTFYSEGFETLAIPNTDWQVNNILPGGNTWAQTAAASSSGTKSAMITNSSAQSGNVDELISPSVNMASITGVSPVLTFKVAYAQRTATDADKLTVFVSSTCGKSWTIRKAIAGATLATAPLNTGNFVPASSQWVTQTVSLTSYAISPDLFVKFVFTSGGGNNIYIDDINISASASGVDELTNNLNFNVYPNPAEEITNINFNLINREKVSLKVFDVVGREITSVYNGELTAGEHQYTLNKSANLSAGVYFVTLNIGGQNFSKKLIVR